MNFTYAGETFYVHFGKYGHGDRLAVFISTADGRPFATLSTNDPTVVGLTSDEFIVKTWSENTKIWKLCERLFVDTGKRLTVGRVNGVPIWRLKQKYKTVVMKSNRGVLSPVAVFDGAEEASTWIVQQTAQEGVLYGTVQVEYRP